MQTASVVRKLEAAGFVLALAAYRTGEFGFFRSARASHPSGPYVVEFSEVNGSVDHLRVRRLDDEDEAVSDYHAGSIFHSIARAIEWATKSNAEWTPDDSLRVARNRRATAANEPVPFLS